MSRQIMLSTVVDTIVCIDGCEIIGAFLAEELTRAGVYSRNAHQTILFFAQFSHKELSCCCEYYTA